MRPTLEACEANAALQDVRDIKLSCVSNRPGMVARMMNRVFQRRLRLAARRFREEDEYCLFNGHSDTCPHEYKGMRPVGVINYQRH